MSVTRDTKKITVTLDLKQQGIAEAVANIMLEIMVKSQTKVSNIEKKPL